MYNYTFLLGFFNKFYQKTSLLHLRRMCSAENAVDIPFFSQSNASHTCLLLHSQTMIYTPSNLAITSLKKHLNFRQFSLFKNTEIKTVC